MCLRETPEPSVEAGPLPVLRGGPRGKRWGQPGGGDLHPPHVFFLPLLVEFLGRTGPRGGLP